MTGMPQKNILMTQMPHTNPENYQNDSNATIFLTAFFTAFFSKLSKYLICSPPLG